MTQPTNKNLAPCVTSYARKMEQVTANITETPPHPEKFSRSSLRDDATTTRRNEGLSELLRDLVQEGVKPGAMNSVVSPGKNFSNGPYAKF